jgi:Xaa-Pro aminopeptidase/Xaa-Pro dipeptidase
MEEKGFKRLVWRARKLTVYAQRRERLLSLAKGKQVAVFTAPNLFYLTDFFGGGAAIVHRDKTVVITTPLEADRAGEVSKEAEIVLVKKWADVEKEAVRRLERGKAFSDQAPQEGRGHFIASPGLFLEARRVKDELEVERVRKACEGTDRVFETIERELRPGRTEWQVAAAAVKAALERRMTLSNSDSSLGPVIVASGPHGAYGHSELSDRKLRDGDFVVADLFFRYEGYHSDETRTFAVGPVGSEMKRHYEIVREAQEAALDSVREGVPCGAVSDAAVSVLRKNKVEKFLNHSVGHGVGIDIHELPRIAKGDRVRLARNDVITDEPGVYFVGKYGVRIEDTVRVDRKAEVMTKYTKDLVTCG